MRHVYRLADAHPPGRAIVAVGIFDGVHLGHQYLLRRLVEEAHAESCVPVVLTFHPHPDVVMGRARARHCLTSPEERAALLGALGVEIVVTHPFDDDVRHVHAAAFVDALLTHLNLCKLWVGADFALGYKREGNVAFLREQADMKGFSLEVVELVTNDGNGQVVSSSNIRAALADGDVAKANRWLGRPYRLAGEVVHGDKRGRTIGFPTANIAVWDQQYLPRKGVYAGWARLGNETFMAVANIGNRPTFNGGTVTVEAHLLDFDRDIYGDHLIFDVVAFLRPEMKFGGIDELIAQIERDVQVGCDLLSQLTTA
jgi:riboflavin kinase/FMN adenylyltransferase